MNRWHFPFSQRVYHLEVTALTRLSFEFVHLIEGKIIITPEGGEAYTVTAGDYFVVEKDFKGTWKIEENVKKHFYIKLK